MQQDPANANTGLLPEPDELQLETGPSPFMPEAGGKKESGLSGPAAEKARPAVSVILKDPQRSVHEAGKISLVRHKLHDEGSSGHQQSSSDAVSSETTAKPHEAKKKRKAIEVFADGVGKVLRIETPSEMDARRKEEDRIRETGTIDEKLKLEASTQRREARRKLLDRVIPPIKFPTTVATTDGKEDLKKLAQPEIRLFKDMANALKGKYTTHRYDGWRELKKDFNNNKDAKAIDEAAKNGDLEPIKAKLGEEKTKKETDLRKAQDEQSRLDKLLKADPLGKEKMDYIRVMKLEDEGQTDKSKAEEAAKLRATFDLQKKLSSNATHRRILEKRITYISGLLNPAPSPKSQYTLAA